MLLSIAGMFGALFLIGIIGAAFGVGKQTPTAAAVAASATTHPAVAVQLSHSTVPSVKASPTQPATPKSIERTTAAAPASSAAPSPTCDMTQEPDVIVRYTVPGMQDTAQVLGGWDPTTCASSIDKIMNGSPLGDGYCTEIAYASDNPGYNADATPAAPLKKVIEAIGGSC